MLKVAKKLLYLNTCYKALLSVLNSPYSKNGKPWERHVTSPSLICHGRATSRNVTSTSDFIRILYCENRQWIIVTSGLGAEYEDAYILNRTNSL